MALMKFDFPAPFRALDYPDDLETTLDHLFDPSRSRNIFEIRQFGLLA